MGIYVFGRVHSIPNTRTYPNFNVHTRTDPISNTHTQANPILNAHTHACSNASSHSVSRLDFVHQHQLYDGLSL